MYSNIGSFELTHTEKQLTNPIPVQGSVNEDDNKNEKDEKDFWIIDLVAFYAGICRNNGESSTG